MPAASQFNTSQTVMRSPRIHGWPERLPGSIVMRGASLEDIIGLQWNVVLTSYLQGIVGAGWPSRNIESACNATIRIYYWIYGAICYEYHVSDTRAEALQEAP